MNKKFMIILAAACIISLGVGTVIGAGLNQNNLSATAAGEIDDIQEILDAYLSGNNNVDPEFLYTAISGMESVLNGYAQRVKAINDMVKETRATLTGIRDMIKEGSFVMTDEIYSDLRDIIEAGSAKIFEDIISVFRDLDAAVSCKPGDTLSRAEWEAIAAKAEDMLNVLRDMADIANYDLQNVTQDYAQAVGTLAAIMKEQHDAIKETSR